MRLIGLLRGPPLQRAIDNPANKKFVKTYREKAKKAASYFSETCYTGARWIVEAIKAVNGDVENSAKVFGGLEKGGTHGCSSGTYEIGRLLNPIQNIYIRRVERVGGELQNTVIYTYPNVSQFWKYKPEEYLKQPLYTRDYPPLKP